VDVYLSPFKQLEPIDARLAEIGTSRRGDELHSSRLSLLRLASFGVLAGGCAAAYFSTLWLAIGFALPGLVAFAVAVVLHGRVRGRLEAAVAEATLLAERRERLTGRRRIRAPIPEAEGVPAPPPDPRERPIEADVASDLSLAGEPRSVFGFLDASSTALGARRLLDMIHRPLLDPAAIRERQEAVSLAAGSDALRDALLGAFFKMRRRSLGAVGTTLAAAAAFSHRAGILLLAHAAGSLAPVLLLLACFDSRAAALFVMSFLFNWIIVAAQIQRTRPTCDRLLVLGPLIDAAAEARRILRSYDPHAALWRKALDDIERFEIPGEKLRRRLRLLELRDFGLLYELFNALLLWELRLLPAAEGLVQNHRAAVEHAAWALGEIEALVSLSLPLAEQTGYTIPEPVEGAQPRFEAEALGHPLIEPGKAVTNDVQADFLAPIALITGSNMAGKSTLLKAVGVNLVLAGMGGPVFARSMRWTPMAVHGDINVRDSLDDGKSYFAVEVERIGRILAESRKSPLLLGILDEPFRGTNSAERQAIAMALLAHLRASGGLYFVATHDLALTSLETEIPGVVNYHFREEVDGGAMTFDYRLRPGPAPTRNAIRVLEARGFPPELVKEARRRLEAGAGGKSSST